MIKSLLIANRGEIACRVIKTAKKMGVRTIAVYSDIDANALHVRIADEAVHIGPSEAVKSYLDMDKILAAAKQSDAEAIHPGYGFLSENPEFAEKCQAANIIFVGPSATSMRQMALKDQAKKLMEESGVPVTPGYHGDDQDPQVLAKAAKNIGFPVLIKAVAGGGGRGMRFVENAAEFSSQLESARRESLASFGNDKVLIEKFIQNPRHIEVQVFGDNHGQVVHFFERDCSVQRRHQKVIEEAPAPGMSKQMRAAMTNAAIKAAQAVNYVNAGTVEFIVDGSGELDPSKFWFMEMNTRLQVEHPVTETITGFDLVQLQLEIASGGQVPKQDKIKLSGHAIEARIYAEQPDREFMPSTGKFEMIGNFVDEFVRLDDGYSIGDTISSYYDPLIAKLISKGSNRALAISRLIKALHQQVYWPIRTNARLLALILSDEEFAAGKHDTGFLGKKLDKLLADKPTPQQIAAYVAEDELRPTLQPNEDAGIWGNIRDGWRLNSTAICKARYQIEGKVYLVEVQGSGSERTILVDGVKVPYPGFQDYNYLWHYSDKEKLLCKQGEVYAVTVPDAEADNSSDDGTNTILAPMPGKILEVQVKAKDQVKAGDVLLVMEAMKMEQSLKAPRDGVVEAVSFAVGDQVVEGAELVLLEPKS